MSSNNLKVYFKCVECPDFSLHHCNSAFDCVGNEKCLRDPENPVEVKTDPFKDIPDFCPRLPF